MTTSIVDNGVNVEALLGAREAFADAPQIARFQTSWSPRSRPAVHAPTPGPAAC